MSTNGPAALLLLALFAAQEDLSKWQETHRPKCGASPAWSTDSKWLFGASQRNSKGVVIVWDVRQKSKNKDYRGTLDTLASGYIATEAAAGRLFGLATSKDNVPHVEVLEEKKGELLKTIVFKEKLTKISDMRVSPDGVVVAVTDGEKQIGLADADDASILYILDGTMLAAGSYRCMAFDAESKRLAVGWGDYQVHLWSLKEKRIERTIKLGGHATAVAFRPDGSSVAVGTTKNEVELWELKGGTRTATLAGHAAPVTALGWSSNSQWLISADSAGTFAAWDGTKAEKIRSEAVPNEAFSQVRFSPDGKYFVLVGRENHIWGKR